MFKSSGFRFAGKLLFFLAAAPALTVGSGPTISGNVDISVTTGNITNSVLGNGASASVEIGSILGGDIMGPVKIVVTTGDIVNSTEGNDTTSNVRIGNIGQ